MRFAGLIILASSLPAFAFVKIGIHRKRINAIQKLILFIEYIKRELSVEPVQMQEMFGKIAAKIKKEEKAVFEKLYGDMNLLGESSFQEIWEENIRIFVPELLDDDLFEIISLSTKLGSCPVDMQINNITACENMLSEMLQKEKSDYPQIRKLYMGLSAAAAAAVIIVFV